MYLSPYYKKTMISKFNSTAAFLMIIVMVFTCMTAVDVRRKICRLNYLMQIQHIRRVTTKAARNTLEHVTKTFGARAPMLYGPKFGVIYYRKGLCELKLAGKLREAIGRLMPASGLKKQPSLLMFVTRSSQWRA